MINLSEQDLKKILLEKGINVSKVKMLRKDSGQKKVYFIRVDDIEYACKVVDVTPYDVYDNFDISNNYNLEGIDRNILNEIFTRINSECKRINTEIKMNKACSNLPQLKFFETINYVFVNSYYWVAYYIEEKFEGSSLQYKNNYSDNEVLDFILQMLNHIKIMYNSGYVHRDLKPDNIIVNEEVYKVIDGGLGKNLKEEEGNSMLSHNLLGTRGYWAPEQQNYPPDYKWNFQTDLYPIGIMAMEMYILELRKNFKTLRDLDEMYIIWKEKFSDNIKRMKVFRNIIVNLSSYQKLNRFNDIDKAILQVEHLKECE